MQSRPAGPCASCLPDFALFRVVNRYAGNLAPMPGVFPDYSAPVIRNTETGRELSMMRWACRRHHRWRAAGHQRPQHVVFRMQEP